MSGVGIISLGLLVLLSLPVVLTDLRERRIPNAWNLALGATGLAIALVRAPALKTLGVAALDAGMTLALFFGLTMLARWLKRPSGLGMGDVKYLVAASLWVGFGGACVLFILASLLAGLTALARAPWQGLDLKSPRPFAPMLAVSLLALTALLDFGRP